ncbi:MAG: NfeD family protein, partial [Actinobacteria bacterium]
LLYLGRPFVMKTIVPKRKITNAEALIGRVEEVFEEIDNNNKTGAIRIHGTLWNAKNAEEHLKIKAGTKVKITDFDGLTAIVEPFKKGGKS